MKLSTLFLLGMALMCGQADLIQGQEVDDNFCYKGTIEDGEVVEMNMEPCDLDQGMSCQTKFEINGDSKSSWRSCKQTDACLSDMASNPVSCYGKNENNPVNRLCFFCCEKPHCNNFHAIPPEGENPVPLPKGYNWVRYRKQGK